MEVVVANTTAMITTSDQVEVMGWFESFGSFIMGGLNLLSETFWYVWGVPMFFYIIIGAVIFISYMIIWPTCRYAALNIKARCKPTHFPYEHVVITGCGTGLGKALVDKIFHRGAVITMIGKDKTKLQQVQKEIDVSNLDFVLTFSV
jgi:hypothetical protein